MLGAEILRLWGDHDPAVVLDEDQGVHSLEQEHRLALGSARGRLHEVEEGQHRGQTGGVGEQQLPWHPSQQPSVPEGLSAGQHQALSHPSSTAERRSWG